MFNFIIIASAILHLGASNECNVADVSITEQANMYCGLINGKSGISPVEAIGHVYIGDEQEAKGSLEQLTEIRRAGGLHLEKQYFPKGRDKIVLFETDYQSSSGNGNSGTMELTSQDRLKRMTWNRRRRRENRGGGTAYTMMSDDKLANLMRNADFDTILSSIEAKTSRNKRQAFSGDMFLNIPNLYPEVTAEAMLLKWSPVGVVPGMKQIITAIGIVGFAETSADIRGTGLWKLSLYGSKNGDGSGEQFQRHDQMLSPSQQARPLIASGGILPDVNMTLLVFVGAKGEIDISAIGCDNEFRFLCFDLTKGDNPVPDFIFKSARNDPSKITTCYDSCGKLAEGTAKVGSIGVSFEADDSVERPSAAQESFSLNVTIGSSKASSNVTGTGLWKLSLYGSRNSDGTGEQFQPIDQLLSNKQQEQPLSGGGNVTFTGLRGRLDLDALGCDSYFRYVCFEFSKGDDPNPDFNFTSLQEDSSKLLLCSDTCKHEEGTVVVNSIKMDLSISDLRPGQNDSFSLNVTIGFSNSSADASGIGLWKLTMYGSKHEDGTGEKFQPIDQLLSENQQSHPAIAGKHVSFLDIVGEFETTAVGCDEEFRYLCLDFMKGNQPQPDFTFRSLDNDTKISVCSDRCSPLKENINMAVIRNLKANMAVAGALPGMKSHFILNVSAIFSEVSIDVRGTGLWKLSMYGSDDRNAIGKQFDRIDQVLSSRQQNKPLKDGEPIDFVNIEGEFDVGAIGCDKVRYLCFDFAKGDRPIPDFNFTSLQSDGSKWSGCFDRCPEREETLMQTGFILVADLGGAIHIAPMDTVSETLSFQPLPLRPLGVPVAVDFDPVHKKVYWTDVLLDVISRCNLDGSNKELVVDLGFQSTPDGLAIDEVHRVLYWTDASLHTIEKANLDGNQRSVVLNSPKPRAIVVDSIERRLFWTDWGDSPKIERANTDGTSRVTLVDTNLKWPNGLTIDFSGGRMYWCDAGFNRIESTDLNGRNRMSHLDTGPLLDIHPFGIAMYQDAILWSDWMFSQLGSLDIDTGRVSLLGSSVFKRAGGIHIQNGLASRARRNAQNVGPFSQCHNLVNPAEYFNRCTYNWCASQSISLMCDDVAEYAKACQDQGVDVGNWREATGCDNIARR